MSLLLSRYSGIDVWEILFDGVQVMRRVGDDYMNATQILKVAGYSKARRTSLLTDIHECKNLTSDKPQGSMKRFRAGMANTKGHELAKRLAEAHGVLKKLDPMFNLDQEKCKQLSALRNTHASKKRLSVPIDISQPRGGSSIPTPIATPHDSPKSSKIAKLAAAAGECLQLDKSETTAAAVKEREPSPDFVNRGVLQKLHSYAHWSKILDPPSKVIGNTIMHWACALGHVDYLASLARIPIKLINKQRQSALAFAVSRQDNFYRQTFPALQPLFSVEPCRDVNGRTYLHTIIALATQADNALTSRYYLECVANWIDEQRDGGKNEHVISSLLDSQILLSLRCLVNIPNQDGETAYSLMRSKPQVYSRILQVLMQNGFDFGLYPRQELSVVLSTPALMATQSVYDQSKSPANYSHPESTVPGIPANSIGEKATQLINRELKPVTDLLWQQKQELAQVEQSVLSVEKDVEQAMDVSKKQNESLRNENRFYQKLIGIVSRLESAIDSLSSLPTVGGSRDDQSLGKRKRAREYEQTNNGDGRLREFVQNIKF